MPYDKLISDYLPDDTINLINAAVAYYDIFFIQNDYSNKLITTKDDKVDLCLFLSIYSLEFDCIKIFDNYLKKYDFNKFGIFEYFGLIGLLKEADWDIPIDRIEKIYNDAFRKQLENDFKMFLNSSNYIHIYPATIFQRICSKDLIYNVVKKLGIDFNDRMNVVLELGDCMKNNKSNNNDNSNNKKCFNINNYANIKEKKQNDEINMDKQNTNKEKDYSLLRKYGVFLDEIEYISNPSIGRDKEIKSVILSLLSLDKSSILVGEAGVGKTAIVEGLSYMIKNNQVPKLLENKKIISINTNSLLSGCQYRGQFEERVENILNYLSHNKEVILFIDEIHTIVGAGQGKDGNLDFSNILKPYLDRGDVKIIGATTKDEYDNIMVDPALRRRFEKTVVEELDNEKIKEVLIKEITKLEKIYNIKFNFNEHEKLKIIDFLINLTDNKNRVYNDKINNPDLVLSILKNTFTIALYYDRNSVILDDIGESINKCDRIYDSIKDREILKLNTMKEKKYQKVIKFKPKQN